MEAFQPIDRQQMKHFDGCWRVFAREIREMTTRQEAHEIVVSMTTAIAAVKPWARLFVARFFFCLLK